MSRVKRRAGTRIQRSAGGHGWRWLRRNRLDLATVASVLLSLLVGLVGNYLVGSWSWASLATLVVLSISLAGLEVLRRRLDNRAAQGTVDDGAGSHSAVAVSVGGQRVETRDFVVAGRDIYQIHRETRIGSGAVLLLALIAAGVVLVVGRAETGADRPSAPSAAFPGDSTGSARTDAQPAYSRSTLLLGSGEDLDPPKATTHLADASFNDDSGLSLLNGASVAPPPTGELLSKATCSAVPSAAWSQSVSMAELRAGLQKCLHTSDDRWGTLAVTSVKSDALGGFLGVTWTVWSS